jgi:hypothetical protein
LEVEVCQTLKVHIEARFNCINAVWAIGLLVTLK